MKITDEMRTIWKDSLGVDNAIQSMANWKNDYPAFFHRSMTAKKKQMRR
jgi:hypothetical protein